MAEVVNQQKNCRCMAETVNQGHAQVKEKARKLIHMYASTAAAGAAAAARKPMSLNPKPQTLKQQQRGSDWALFAKNKK
jgi:hypothetical protein